MEERKEPALTRASNRDSNRISNHLSEYQDTVNDLLTVQESRRDSGYAKRKKRSSTYNKRPSLTKSNKSSGRRTSRAISVYVEEKRLPTTFAESILDLELQIDRGTFTMDTIS